MQQLKRIFNYRGFTYTLIERTQNAACFELTSDGKTVGFETVEIVKQEEHSSRIAGKTVNSPAKEKLPSDEQFGAKGFFYMSNQKNQAIDRLAQIEAKKQSLKNQS